MVVETPRGSAAKFEFNPALQVSIVVKLASNSRPR
jgi:hypothetical protein